LATLVLTACQTPKPVELPAPAADSTVVHFVGTPLSGPTLPSVGTSAPRLRPEELLGVRVTMIVLEHMPHNALEPLGAHARLIVAARGEDPVLPTTRLTLDARYGRFASLIAPGELNKVLPLAVTGRSRSLADLRGVLPAGVTASFRVADRRWFADPLAGKPVQRYLRVDLYRPEAAGATLQVALTMEDAPLAPRTADIPPALQRETALLDPPDGPCLVLLAPFVFSDCPAEAVAIVIGITRNVGTDYAAAQDACRRDLANPAVVPPAVVQSFDWTLPAITAAMSGLDRPESRRASLVFLGDQTGAPILTDLALVADESVLARLVARFRVPSDPRSDAAPMADKQALGWRLDLAALGLLRDMQAGGAFPRELAAVLLAYTGEAGRHASSLEEICNGLTNSAELQRRLIAENTQYLEDGSPAARVRAYDWLRAREKAPPGYDPLASPRERRDALEKALHPSAAGGAP
jgi:hypothetical protein